MSEAAQVKRGGLLKLALWGAAALIGPAGSAAAGEGLFAPQAKSQGLAAQTPEPARITAGSALVSPEIVVDEQGRKTLVIRGEAAGAASPPPARRTLLMDDPARKPADPPEDKPYWLVETRTVSERPYFLADKKENDRPYWLKEEEQEETPYWRLKETRPERPYWEKPPERVEIISQLEPAVTSPPPPPEPAGDLRSISYFMFQDEFGVKRLTNVPDDPRYREFTVVVRLTRGQTSLGRLRFTHDSLRPLILRAAQTYRLDPALIAAVIKSESAFDAHAVSWAGAQGLMQLMPATARAMGCADSFDPEQNIMAGSRYLRLMLNTFGEDLTLAIASYNCGPERVKRLWRVPNIPETKNYVVIVTRNYERYKGQL